MLVMRRRCLLVTEGKGSEGKDKGGTINGEDEVFDGTTLERDSASGNMLGRTGGTLTRSRQLIRISLDLGRVYRPSTTTGALEKSNCSAEQSRTGGEKPSPRSRYTVGTRVVAVTRMFTGA